MPDLIARTEELADDVQRQFLLAPQFRVAVRTRFPRARLRLAAAWSTVASNIGDMLFERGLETKGVLQEVAHYHPDRVWYHASGWTYLRRALGRHEVSRDDVFLDLGAGKGRVLLQAACGYRFRRVIGVEISERLSEVARANVNRSRRPLRSEVEVVTADAASYEIPDDVTVIYLYYPFVGETFQSVTRQITASLTRRPRRVRVIYALPFLEDQLLATGMFRRVRNVRIVCQGVPHHIAVYESSTG